MIDIVEGAILAGKYRVERVLGQGGMGVVVAAHHLQLDEKVAIKFLLSFALPSPQVVGRFVREARAAVRIKSEHVARVSDVGTLEDGSPYMVMEYLEGADLAAWLKERGALLIDQAVEFLLQAMEAIAEAHALGIVHRDLKPANLFVVRRADGLWSVKVLDFGISKVRASGDDADVDLTKSSAMMGSPLYMPPEQMIAARDVDSRSDIWALGVILYELLAGKSPFLGESLPEVCMKIAKEAPPPLRAARPEVPAALETVILRCLEKERQQRYANVSELASALIEFGPPRARGSVDRISRTIAAAGVASGTLVLTSNPEPSASHSAQAAAPVAIGDVPTQGNWGRTASHGGGNRRLAGWGALLLAGSAATAVGLKWAASSSKPLDESSLHSAAPATTRAPSVVVAASGPPRVLSAPATASSVPEVGVGVTASSSNAPAVATGKPRRQSEPRSRTPTKPPVGENPIETAAPPAPPRPPEKGSIFDDR